MDEGTIALTVMTGLLLISFIGLLFWGIRTGQFKNVEEPKYRMLGDKDDQTPGGAKPPKAGSGGGEKK